jgi:hypothetical protein
MIARPENVHPRLSATDLLATERARRGKGCVKAANKRAAATARRSKSTPLYYINHRMPLRYDSGTYPFYLRT